MRQSMVSALRMRFPAEREFVFDVAYTRFTDSAGYEDAVEVRDRGGGRTLPYLVSITRLVLLQGRGVSFRNLVLASQRKSGRLSTFVFFPRSISFGDYAPPSMGALLLYSSPTTT